jgi:serine/threonine protein kinase
MLLLGPKKSESGYSAEDRRLLAAIAAQIAIVHENATLKRRAAADARARHEVLAHLDASGINLLKECPACGRCFDRAAETCAADGAALRLSLPVDRTVDGKYRLDLLLGRGGMGAVYEATDLRLGRRVAVKIMTGASFGNQDAQRRFEREARASARLEHPNIITVFDYGPVGADGAYLVMERLAGTTLRAALQRPGGLPPEAAAQVFDEMLEGVAGAHRAGVIHRDLKPENVFLAEDGKGGQVVKVLDFGLAKLTLDGEDASSLTAAGTVMGTLAYMSPEQLKGQPVDVRTDVFAIGVMAAEAATGVNPFKKADTTQTVAAILHQAFHLGGDDPDAQALDAVLQRCLAKDRSERFDTVADARAALVPALRAYRPARAAGAAGSEEFTWTKSPG